MILAQHLNIHIPRIGCHNTLFPGSFLTLKQAWVCVCGTRCVVSAGSWLVTGSASRAGNVNTTVSLLRFN